MKQFLKENFFFYEQNGYLLIPSRLEENVDFCKLKETSKSFEYNDTWTKYTFFPMNDRNVSQVAEIDHLIPRIVCCGCTNYNDALLWRHGAIFNWKDSVDVKILVYVNNSILTIFIGERERRKGRNTMESFLDLIQEMRKFLPDTINDGNHSVTEGITTMNILQEPGLRKYFIYNNNCIDRSKRKALIINCWDNDIDKNRIVDILRYLDFDITIMDVYCDDFNSSDELEELIENYTTNYFENLAFDDYNYRDDGCFCCFIIGHGDKNDYIDIPTKVDFNNYNDSNDYIFRVNGNYYENQNDCINLKKIIEKFEIEDFKAVRRLFFVDTCRGDDNAGDNDLIGTSVNGENILIVQATTPGSVSKSKICKESGHEISCFFESMIEVLFENHHKDPIQTILLTKLVQRRCDKLLSVISIPLAG